MMVAVSAAASALICFVNAFFIRPDSEKEAIIQQELASNCYQIESICERIGLWEKRIVSIRNSPALNQLRYSLAVPAWQAKITEYRTVTLPALELKKLQLQAELSGFDRNLTERFIIVCREKFLLRMSAILIFLLAMPLVISLVVYFVIARFAERVCPFYLPDTPQTPSGVTISPATPSLTVKISGREHFYLRPNWCRAKSSITAATRFIWKKSAPLVSFAADLFELIDFSADGGSCGEFTVTPPVENLMISEISLEENSSIILRPRHLIGVSDGIRIRTIWDFSPVNIICGRIRQIQFCGKGRILIAGAWGIEAGVVSGHPHVIEEEMIVAVSGDSGYAPFRSATWWHYFRKKSPLFNIRILSGTVICQNHPWEYRKPNASLLERCVNFFLNAVGSFLGF